MDLTGLEWRKSSFGAATSSGGCVEVAHLPDGGVAIRDSKDPNCVPHVFTAHEWECFVAGVHNGEFDCP